MVAATNLPPAQASGDIIEANYITTEGATTSGRADPHNTFNINPGLPAAATSKTAPDWKPAANAPALTAGTAPPNDGFFDTSATFAGTIGAVDWTTGWTKYPQN